MVEEAPLSEEHQPVLYVFAGPNGSGKSTLAAKLLLDQIPLINSDIIAAEQPGISEIDAGRIAINERNALLEQKKSLAIETTLSGNSELRFIASAKKAGYFIDLNYVGLNGVDRNIKRVRDRVSRGEHNVPTDAIERRWYRSMANLFKAIAQSDAARVFDNSKSSGFDLIFRTAQRVRENRILFFKQRPPRWFRRVYQANKEAQQAKAKGSGIER